MRAASIGLHCLLSMPLTPPPIDASRSPILVGSLPPIHQNLTLNDAEIRYIDGDALVVRNSNTINIDAGEYEE